MTPAELEAVLQRLQHADPTSRVSHKRQLLSSAREPIIALYQRGHSWRALARELSTAMGETISADLLRTACLKHPQRRPRRRSTRGAAAPKPQPTRTPEASLTPAHQAASTPTNDRFGAKGLKL